jgi:hypothetical protein
VLRMARGSSVGPTSDEPRCPQCGKILLTSITNPHGTAADGTDYLAKECRREGLWFGRGPDGSWTVRLTPVAPV